MGILVGRRIALADAVGYWVAQVIGGIVGAAGLYGIFHLVSSYHKSVGLGADGYGKSSMIGANAAGVFIAEVVLTSLFVFVILAVTRWASNATVAGLVIGLSLTPVHIIGDPDRRDLGEPGPQHRPGHLRRWHCSQAALGLHRGTPDRWALSALLHKFLYPKGEEEASTEPAPQEQAT
jgi:aquaporin Z